MEREMTFPQSWVGGLNGRVSPRAANIEYSESCYKYFYYLC